ncbi:MAG: glycosyltransferase [Betaproteobacteria bacterium HGW-Betaproteobacteria-22]|nr:MAG: glycosyltransferase [Betaproteobacteria bacterium HGW-Betaproteobacteria-22]
MIRVFIGFDTRETVAFHVLSHSIHTHASQPVSITPIMLTQLNGIFKREVNPLQSTQFSFSRFLTPYLSNFEGWSIFMDCDMVVTEDIAKLWAMRDDRYAVMCIKHDHNPVEETKFLGAIQTKYQKKNWSSVMLFNNAKCRALTPEYVNTATGLELHQFKWLGDDALIGELPITWNHLVGYNPPNPNAALIHYTLGGPYFNEYIDCEHADTWFKAKEAMQAVTQRSQDSAVA